MGFIDFGFHVPVSENVSTGLSFASYLTHASKQNNAYYNRETDDYKMYYVKYNLKIFPDRINQGLFFNVSGGLMVSSDKNSDECTINSGEIFTFGVGKAFEWVKNESSFLVGLDLIYAHEKIRTKVTQSGFPYSTFFIDSKRNVYSLMIYGGIFW